MTRVLGSWGTLLATSMVCLSFAGCGSGNGSGSGPTPPVQPSATDETTMMLPGYIGTFASPSAKMRIHDDATFTLQTSDEQVEFHATGDLKDDRVGCDIIRKGTIQILSVSGGNTIFRMNITGRKVAGAEQESAEAPSPICEKYVDLLGQTGTINLQLINKVKKAFYVASALNVHGVLLDSVSTAQASAHSTLFDEFGMLMAASDQTVDVTDLAGISLQGAFEPSIIRVKAQDQVTITIDAELHQMHYQDANCKIDTQAEFNVTENNGTIMMNSGGPSSLAGVSQQVAQDVCRARTDLVGPPGGAPMFDVSDPFSIEGKGSFTGLNFSKQYTN